MFRNKKSDRVRNTPYSSSMTWSHLELATAQKPSPPDESFVPEILLRGTYLHSNRYQLSQSPQGSHEIKLHQWQRNNSNLWNSSLPVICLLICQQSVEAREKGICFPQPSSFNPSGPTRGISSSLHHSIALSYPMRVAFIITDHFSLGCVI